ncbi:uncharacterized protein LOC141574951 [Camelus bactrianus]|uniref:Uncharacterized protein LOC141574951 n=1 Tax=Camelus bactrianus TaxID=9837 RepID=A0AC58PF52_CAMBA
MNRWRRSFTTNHHRRGRGWLFSKTLPGESRLPPLPGEAPTRGARTRGLPLRLRCGRTPVRLSPMPGGPARVKNCVTRSERGGHLLLRGTSVRAEEERCAGAPKTVPGDSHLTGEASPASPEVWCFCAAGEEAVAAEAAEYLLIPGCETFCWVASDPLPGVRKINNQTPRKLLKASSISLKKKVTRDFYFSKVLCNVLKGNYKE